VFPGRANTGFMTICAKVNTRSRKGGEADLPVSIKDTAATRAKSGGVQLNMTRVWSERPGNHSIEDQFASEEEDSQCRSFIGVYCRVKYREKGIELRATLWGRPGTRRVSIMIIPGCEKGFPSRRLPARRHNQGSGEQVLF
jgi:hypothetical protein